MSELKYELVDVDRLIPYINNARTHSKEQVTRLASSKKEHCKKATTLQMTKTKK